MDHVIQLETGAIVVPNSGVLQTYAEIVETVNQEKGWYDADRTFGDDIALLHSEVSEALEDYRAGRLATTFRSSDGKPEGLPSELADILVRLLDTCSRYNVDLEHEFLMKVSYNATRDHRHGNKAL